MKLRTTLGLAIAAGVAASTFQVAPASASVCWTTWRELTGTCSPCNQIAPVYYKVTGDYLICLA